MAPKRPGPENPRAPTSEEKEFYTFDHMYGFHAPGSKPATCPMCAAVNSSTSSPAV